MTAVSSFTIDLTRVPAPQIIETFGFDRLLSDTRDKFLEYWAAERTKNPALPAYNVEKLRGNPVNFILSSRAYREGLLRQRINEAVAAVLAPLAHRTDLDNVVARAGIERLVVTPATTSSPAIMESDERLLLRYLLAFARPAAGSADRYLLEVYTALPTLQHAAVNGPAVHGRRGDVDVVLAGPNGRDLTDDELAACRSAILATNVKPEAVAVVTLRARRIVYDLSGSILVPRGPDPETVRVEAERRIGDVAAERMKIGAIAPLTAFAGAAYGAGVTRASIDAPADDIVADSYSIPVLGDLALTAEAQA
ncbi:MAG TPA: baseplate J/gp47 family protein [Methylocystis sp.]|jgi:phage-related baseplate assembly protein